MKVIFAEVIMKNIINISVLVHCTCSLFCHLSTCKHDMERMQASKDKEKH